MKRVMIIIPVFYREHLEKSIRSILRNNCDIILVNDSDIPLKHSNSRVTIVENGRNLGVGISRNRGVQKALEGNYDLIGFVDSDSVISREWRSVCERTLEDDKILGVSGLALNPNQKSKIARVKFVLKDYGRRNTIPFQIDCSLFKREVFSFADFGERRIGEDSFFLGKMDRTRLVVNENAVSYHHEVESVSDFFKKEIVGAMYSMSSRRNIAKSILLTPLTCFKMLLRSKTYPDYANASLVWLIRQIAWSMAYLAGRLANIGSKA
ncbi:MAG: glycosyltransferase [Candidatus Thorarchaeota archaeon]|nr:MAG: glycosyltransferase [Candidatus Thorarchaeota archaeon]